MPKIREKLQNVCTPLNTLVVYERENQEKNERSFIFFLIMSAMFLSLKRKDNYGFIPWRLYEKK